MSAPTAPKGVYLTTHAGTPIYVNEDGTFTCTYRGEVLKRGTLVDLKRRIKARAVEPIRYMTTFEIQWHPYGEMTGFSIIGQDANHPDWLHSDSPHDMRHKVGDVYHFDQSVIDEARALYAQEKAIHDRRAALVTKLRPITRADLIPRGEGE